MIAGSTLLTRVSNIGQIRVEETDTRVRAVNLLDLRKREGSPMKHSVIYANPILKCISVLCLLAVSISLKGHASDCYNAYQNSEDIADLLIWRYTTRHVCAT